MDIASIKSLVSNSPKYYSYGKICKLFAALCSHRIISNGVSTLKQFSDFN